MEKNENEAVIRGLTGGAKFLEISISYLRMLADRGAIPSLRDDCGRRLFLPQDLLAFKQRREKQKANGGRPRLRFKPRSDGGKLRLRPKE